MPMRTDKLYLELGNAIQRARSIPPCMGSDPDAWFPELHQANAREVKVAKNLCGQCPVQKECLIYAMGNPELQGIWGGLTPRERSVLRPRRRA